MNYGGEFFDGRGHRRNGAEEGKAELALDVIDGGYANVPAFNDKRRNHGNENKQSTQEVCLAEYSVSLAAKAGWLEKSIREMHLAEPALYAPLSLTRVRTVSYRVQAASAFRCSSFSFAEAALH